MNAWSISARDRLRIYINKYDIKCDVADVGLVTLSVTNDNLDEYVQEVNTVNTHHGEPWEVLILISIG